MKASVHLCTRRRDDKFLIVAGRPGQTQLTGISEVEIKPGKDAVFSDGKARPA